MFSAFLASVNTFPISPAHLTSRRTRPCLLERASFFLSRLCSVSLHPADSFLSLPRKMLPFLTFTLSSLFLLPPFLSCPDSRNSSVSALVFFLQSSFSSFHNASFPPCLQSKILSRSDFPLLSVHHSSLYTLAQLRPLRANDPLHISTS
eukprot:TRINITY_DN32966_c0_g1_i1.p1 TRINITY_DN32966_c0_g1~~TRINITY_DN32966_c0_g1_i1.p1  ORF type:complete len:149 (+),score=5.85 TRINITY_DN32966_c0_g1_i1:222-668(+)